MSTRLTDEQVARLESLRDTCIAALQAGRMVQYRSEVRHELRDMPIYYDFIVAPAVMRPATESDIVQGAVLTRQNSGVTLTIMCAGNGWCVYSWKSDTGITGISFTEISKLVPSLTIED